jgi:hypothetical protein
MLIDVLPVWALFVVSVALVLGSAEIGYRLGRSARGTDDPERESPASSISGVVLGLLAFMLAFTFSIVTERYDLKKSLVREEANVIRTAWYRSDFLPVTDRERSKTLLQNYVAARLAVATGGEVDREFLQNAADEAVRTHKQLWEMALSNGRLDMNSDIGALYVESVNELANLHALRIGIGINARVPTTIWIVLVCLLTLGMFGLGYYTAIADSRRSRVTIVLAIAFSMVFALIAALDRPGSRFMPVDQSALINLLSEMKVDTEIGAE